MHRRIVPHPAPPLSAGERPPAALATIASPWGPLHVATTERGIVAVSWLGPVDEVEAWLARRHAIGTVAAAGLEPADPRRRLLEQAVAALERWLAGDEETFDDLPLDLAGLSTWDRTVLEGVRGIPWGRTDSYGGVARRIGRPGAARAVGGAVGRNPIGVIIPCHRVIAGDGSLGGYGGDAWGSHESRQELKRALLRVEGVAAGRSTN